MLKLLKKFKIHASALNSMEVVVKPSVQKMIDSKNKQKNVLLKSLEKQED